MDASADSALKLFRWYERHLCNAELRDPRGMQVIFTPESFVHFAKLTDRYGTEPKNTARVIQAIKQERFHLRSAEPFNYDPQRVGDLRLAPILIREPQYILPNWQPQGRAYPGEVYVREFSVGKTQRTICLVCGFAGKRRLGVTMFYKKRLRDLNLGTAEWP